MTEDQKVKLLTLLSNVEDELQRDQDSECSCTWEALDILRVAIEKVAENKTAPE